MSKKSKSGRKGKSMLVFIIGIAVGAIIVGCITTGRGIPKGCKKGEDGTNVVVKPSSRLPPPPTTEQLREVVGTGMLSLVEAQFTFYAHVKLRERFAENMREMGNREDNEFGVVLVMGAWYADYDNRQKPYHGYWFKVMAVENETDKKGFAIIAVPENEAPNWPVFITHIKNAQGGSSAMRAADTWCIDEPKLASKLYRLLGKRYLTLNDLTPFSPENGITETIKGFKL